MANGGEVLLCFQGAITERVERSRYLGDVRISELAKPTGHHGSHIARVDEQRLAGLLLVPGDDPQTHRYAGAVEKLIRHRDDAFDQISVHDFGTDLALVVRLTGQRAVRQNHAHAA